MSAPLEVDKRKLTNLGDEVGLNQSTGYFMYRCLASPIDGSGVPCCTNGFAQFQGEVAVWLARRRFLVKACDDCKLIKKQ
jgi:hypothetical protein